MGWLKPLWLLGVGVVAIATAGFLLRPKPAPDQTALYRSYTATGQVVGVKALAGGRCRVQVKLHSWSSLSPGFTLADTPRKGQVYAINATPQNCTALEVALAAQGSPDDLKSPRHIYYQAAQARSGDWVLTQAPQAPVGCGGL